MLIHICYLPALLGPDREILARGHETEVMKNDISPSGPSKASKGRTIKYLRGGGWANTKKKFTHAEKTGKKYRAQQTY